MQRVILKIVRVLLLLVMFPACPALTNPQQSGTDGQKHELDRSTEFQNDFIVPTLNKRVEANLPVRVRFSRTRLSVVLEIAVDESGTIAYVRTLTGNRSLRDAATKAVRQWRFEPASSNGIPAKAVGVITFCFSRDSKVSTSTYTFSFQRCCPGSSKKAKPPCSNQSSTTKPF
jgi:TonB family protein